MNINNRKSIIMLLLALLLLLSMPSAAYALNKAYAANKTYNAAVVPFAPPYQYIQDGKIVGAHVEILNKIGAVLKTEFKYIPYDNYTEAVKALKNNDVSLILGIPLNQKDKYNLIYSAPISQDNISIMSYKNKVDITNYPLNSYAYSAATERSVADINEITPIISLPCWISSTTQEAYNVFKNQDLDMLIGPRASLKKLMSESKDSKKYTISDNYIATIDYGIAMNSNNKNVLQIINDEIFKLKISGNMDRILNKWIPNENISKTVFRTYIITFIFICVIALIIIFVSLRLSVYLKSQIDAKTKSLQVLNKELEEQILKVRNANELKECLIENHNEGVVVFNKERRITIFNDRARKIIGLNFTPTGLDIFQISLFNHLLEDIKENMFDKSINLLNQIKSITDDLGNVKTYDYNIFPLFTSDNKVRAVTLIFDDITEQQNLERELHEKEKSKSLNRIVAGMAHEIRNPLTSIKTFIELLQDKKDDELFQQKLAEIVPREIERINSLITNLIEYAKPEKIEYRRTNLKEIIQDAIELLKHSVEQKNVSLSYECDKNIFINVDEQQLKQILINFVINSLDAIILSEKAEDRQIIIKASSDEAYAYISVTDFGIGMTEQEVRNCMEPFYSTKWNGTGLGMYIAKRYVERNNGTMSIESKKGEYTKIFLKFQLI
ncbi:ATP-binding protein [Lutispora sp.]|uniref:ATP-binding protein n=1 Tax=Lutispora sp. TaxID=2828727 RepID=UPI002B211E89|nr:transporter substrate-binding domain-containing protein [Lutispora sp.]MEA4962588.1 transporter substrate-binding domain-containing protein [Lutispora sp.]